MMRVNQSCFAPCFSWVHVWQVSMNERRVCPSVIKVSAPNSGGSSWAARNAKLPVFLLAERNDAAHVPAEVMSEADGFIWLLEDSMEFISSRILAAVRRYRGWFSAAPWHRRGRGPDANPSPG